MKFLKFAPIVYVIDDNYEIFVVSNKNGISSIKVGGKVYYENNSGVLSSEKNYAKISIPQKALDKCKSYDVQFRETIERKSYFSQFGSLQSESFEFKPLEKKDDINIYHFADIHGLFDESIKALSFYNGNIDLLIINGDTGEVHSEQSYLDMVENIAELSCGKIPVIFVRGNHEARGNKTELFDIYFPNVNKKFYYRFKVGCLSGVVLDCGEDKYDNHPEYGGVNAFEQYRRQETKFLQNLKPQKNKLFFAISHICPSCTTLNKNDQFDIEKDVYKIWNSVLEKLGVAFMLTGHLHFYDILKQDDERNTLDHNYPVIIGSAVNYDKRYLLGTYLTINGKKLHIKFTNNKGEIEREEVIEI